MPHQKQPTAANAGERSSSSKDQDYVEVMEQQLEDAKFHEARSAAYRAKLAAVLGHQLAELALSRDACPEFRRLVELAVAQGFDTFDGQQLARSVLKDQVELHSVELENIQLRRSLKALQKCLRQTAELQARADSALERDKARQSQLADKIASNDRQIDRDTAEAKKFQEAADTLQSNLHSPAGGYKDSLSHNSLVEMHLANQHLAGEKRALVASQARYHGLSPDPSEATRQVDQLEKRLALLEARIHEQGKFLL